MLKSIEFKKSSQQLISKKEGTSTLENLRELSAHIVKDISERLNMSERALLLGISTPGVAGSLSDNLLKKTMQLFIIEPDAILFSKGIEEQNEKNLPKNRMILYSINPTDLMLNPEIAEKIVTQTNISCYKDYCQTEQRIALASKEHPFIENESVDLCIMDLMTNRFDVSDFKKILKESFRTLRKNGKLILTAILTDEPIIKSFILKSEELNLPYFLPENELSVHLEKTGYHGITYKPLSEMPLIVVDGIELRYFVLEAFKGKQGPCFDQGHAVFYLGPWKEVIDDDEHSYKRGQRTAVCEKTYRILTQEPYADQFIGIPPYELTPLDLAPLFDCHTPLIRDPKITKGKR